MHGPETWNAGEMYPGTLEITLRMEWSSPFATLYIGLYKKSAQSEKDRMTIVTGKHDGKGRVEVARIPVKLGAKPTAPQQPAYVLKRATAPITIDGKMD